MVLLDRPDGDIVFLYKDKYICTFIPVTGKSKMKQNERKKNVWLPKKMVSQNVQKTKTNSKIVKLEFNLH